jgi:hypothetical protein
MIWIRGNLFFPDQRRFWIKPSVSYLTDFIKRNNIDLIITSGPPHSMHLIGRNLKRRNGIPWIADFRDPWTNWDLLNEMRLSSWSRKIHARMEKTVLKESDLVLAASETWANEFRSLGAGRAESVTNGFEEGDFQKTAETTPRRFQIGHYGMINEMREPRSLLKVLKDLYQEDETIRKSLNVVFAGIIEPSFRKKIEADPVLNQFVHVKSYIPHDQLLQEYSDNYALLLIQNDSSMAEGHIPGKFFEYLASGRYILFQGKDESDVAKIIRETSSGFIYSNENKEEIRKMILMLFNQFNSGQGRPSNDAHLQFTRKNLTAKLVKFMGMLIS